MNREIIPKYAYRLLKILDGFSEPLLEKELKEMAVTGEDENEWLYIKGGFDYLYELGGTKYALMEFSYSRKKWNSFVITERGKQEIQRYEWYINYCDETDKDFSGNGEVVIYDRKSGMFVWRSMIINYSPVFWMTSDLGGATNYKTIEAAKKELEHFLHHSPISYQNSDGYCFSVEKIEKDTKLIVPKTFVCRDCGKVHPIKDRFVSMECPESWDTGLCMECHYAAKMQRNRNQYGVMDYDSL